MEKKLRMAALREAAIRFLRQQSLLREGEYYGNNRNRLRKDICV